jgi:Domain of unknown function (DUF4249)
MIRYFIILFTVLILLTLSCVRRINPPITEGAATLVVEGMITTTAPPYQVKLSYSGKYTNASIAVDTIQNYINDARVIIADDAGDSTICGFVAAGTYQSTDSNFVGIVGRTYTLRIYLSDGQVFSSRPEKISPVPPIDSITAVYDPTSITGVRPTQFIVSAHTQDPGSQVNYYRWMASGYIPRKSFGFNYPPSPAGCDDPFLCDYKAECDQLIPSTQANVLSDQYINGHEFVQQVYNSPLYWYGIHYLQVFQYSLTQDVYTFWLQYTQQTNLTGSVIDPLPQSLVGNIHNAADTTQLELGYFEASDVKSRKAVILIFGLQEYYLEDDAVYYILHGDCQLTYPNSLPDDTTPSKDWQGSDTIRYSFY